MEEIKSLTYRAEEALVKAMEANEAEPMVLAELGKAFADDDEDEDGSYQLPPAAYEYEDIQDEAA